MRGWGNPVRGGTAVNIESITGTPHRISNSETSRGTRIFIIKMSEIHSNQSVTVCYLTLFLVSNFYTLEPVINLYDFIYGVD